MITKQDIMNNSNDGSEVYTIKTCLLKELCNPYNSSCWIGLNCPITHQEITEAINNKDFLDPKNVPIRSFAELCCDVDHKAIRKEHIARIAYLVVNKNNTPVDIDVGIPGYSYVNWNLVDGNHRFAAALYREDLTIETTFTGSIDDFIELLQPISMRKEPYVSLEEVKASLGL
jgi:hypothetical protein